MLRMTDNESPNFLVTAYTKFKCPSTTVHWEGWKVWQLRNLAFPLIILTAICRTFPGELLRTPSAEFRVPSIPVVQLYSSNLIGMRSRHHLYLATKTVVLGNRSTTEVGIRKTLYWYTHILGIIGDYLKNKCSYRIVLVKLILQYS